MKSSRWRYIIAAIVINLCLGAVYAFSILVYPLESEFGWQRIETSPAFTIALLTFALSMIPAGRLQDRKGPRVATSIGGILLGVGMFLASYTSSLMWLYVSYGLLVGLGIGFAYGAPIATCNKWFPDKKGLATGLVVFGFGGGAIVFAPLWTYLIDAFGWRNTFLITGFVFAVLTLVASQVLKNPTQDYRPDGWNPSVKSSSGSRDFGLMGMVKTLPFFLLWFSYWFGTTAGLMTISQAKQVAFELAGIDLVQASLLVSVLGAFNAVGRIMWGFLGDRFGREKMLVGVFSFCLVGLLLVAGIFFVPLVFTVGIVLIGLCFGGFLALYPALTSDYYGSKNLGLNYGLMFTAYGAGSVLGPIMASYFRTFTGDYLPAFYIASILAALGIALAFAVNKKNRPSTG